MEIKSLQNGREYGVWIRKSDLFSGLRGEGSRSQQAAMFVQETDDVFMQDRPSSSKWDKRFRIIHETCEDGGHPQ